MTIPTPAQTLVWRRRQKTLFASISEDPSGLQALLRMHDAIIGGSTAVLFFYPQASFDLPNTDIFVPGEGAPPVVQFFVGEGFAVTDHTLGPGIPVGPPLNKPSVVTYGAGVESITRLQRAGDVINIYRTIGPATHPLTCMWTTLLMSFIGADGACCAYPTLSAGGRGLYHPGRILDYTFPSGDDLPINKYAERRGFELAVHPTNWFELPAGPQPCDRGYNCPLTLRHFGDAGCLNISLAPGGLDAFASQWVFGGVTEEFHAATDSL
ncbi:hypothetical protein C8Q79DRAFT_438760 [Trametes meyenii]|nr:hypothetical protein C8Q79DRAFT_438760 [Trametes meyenii]